MDMNGKIAALLRDFAAIQKSKQSMWGYKRAASAILALEEPIESLLQPDGTLRKIPNIGPSSTRVILEILNTGTSPTIERAIDESGQHDDVARHGDLQMHSTWSDGSQTLAQIVEAGIERGYGFCGVTDHSYGLPIARGETVA